METTEPTMHKLFDLALTVNGTRYEQAVEPRLLLSDFLRHDLGLTGTHVACEHGVCGACTVLLDDEPIRSCLVFAVQAHGHSVTTVEGLGDIDQLHPVQEAFRQAHGVQCGFCTPGILTTVVAFLAENSRPERGRDPRGAFRKPVPLHWLPAHRRRRPAGRPEHESRTPSARPMMDTPSLRHGVTPGAVQ